MSGGDAARLRAIVTGASRGIGRAIAIRLGEDGWQVFNLDRIPPADDDPAGGTWIETDLADVAAIEAALEQILSDGPVTGLVNNAALMRPTLLQETAANDMDASHAVNLRAPMLLAKAVAPGMREGGFGRIVNISSRAQLGKTHRTAYAATKAGIAAMGRVWALELADAGVTVNTVAPGPIRTEMFEASNPPDMPRTQEIVDSIPVGRLGEPEDIAEAVAFFMAPRAGYVTGQTLYVCGGVTLARGGS